MTYRDQLEFKIRKLTRAIDAMVELSGDYNLTAGVVETMERLKQKRAHLRRTIATGRRSCGECGNPMSRHRNSGGTFWLCDTDDCLIHGTVSE